MNWYRKAIIEIEDVAMLKEHQRKLREKKTANPDPDIDPAVLSNHRLYNFIKTLIANLKMFQNLMIESEKAGDEVKRKKYNNKVNRTRHTLIERIKEYKIHKSVEPSELIEDTDMMPGEQETFDLIDLPPELENIIDPIDLIDSGSAKLPPEAFPEDYYDITDEKERYIGTRPTHGYPGKPIPIPIDKKPMYWGRKLPKKFPAPEGDER